MSTLTPSGVSPVKVHLHGPATDQSTPLSFDQPVVRIGRADHCDLQLDHADVSRVHALIVRDPQGRVFFKDLESRTGSLLDNTACSEAWISNENEISIGPFSLKIDCNSHDGPGLCKRDPRLPDKYVTVSSSKIEPVTFRLDRVLTLIGKEKPSEVRLRSRTVAKVHAACYRDQSNVWLINLQASEVTRNAEPIEHCEIIDGDRIEVGRYSLLFRNQLPRSETKSNSDLAHAPSEDASEADMTVLKTADDSDTRLSSDTDKLHQELALLQRTVSLQLNVNERITRELATTNERMNRIDRVLDEVQRGQQERDIVYREQSQLFSKLEDQLAKLEQLQSSLDDNPKVEKLYTTVEDQEARFSEMQLEMKKLAELHACVGQLQARELETEKDLERLHSLQAEVQQHSQQLRSLRSQVDSIPTMLDEAGSRVQSQLELKLLEHSRSWCTIEEAEQQYRQVSDSLVIVAEGLATVQSENEVSYAAVAELKANISAIEETVGEFRSRVEDFSDRPEEVSALKQQCADLETQLRASQEAFTQLEVAHAETERQKRNPLPVESLPTVRRPALPKPRSGNGTAAVRVEFEDANGESRAIAQTLLRKSEMITENNRRWVRYGIAAALLAFACGLTWFVWSSGGVFVQKIQFALEHLTID